MKPAGILAVVASAGCHFALCGCSLLFEESAISEVDSDASPSSVDARPIIDAGDPGDVDAGDPEECPGTVATFEDLPDGFPLLSIYAGLNFEASWVGYQAGDFMLETAAVAFDSNRPSGKFGFELEEQTLHGLRVYSSGTPATVTIGDKVNPDRSVSLDAETKSAYITTNWATPSPSVFVTSTAGFQFFLDDICHSSVP